MQISVQLIKRVVDGEGFGTRKMTGMIQKTVKTVGRVYIDVTLAMEPRFWRVHCPRLELHHLIMWKHSMYWWPVTHTHTYIHTHKKGNRWSNPYF